MTEKNLNTPVMKQFLDIKSKYKNSILLFRMGDFYETFLEDAVITSKILGIVLTKRSNGKASNVDLAGFPYHSLDNYLPKLVKAGHRVAICEQVEDPRNIKGIVKREVVEVVTPGTLMTDRALNNKSNRFIGSCKIFRNNIGYAFLDASTGDFFVGECTEKEFKAVVLKYLPNEMIISEEVTYSSLEWYIEYKPFISKINDWMFEFNTAYRELLDHFNLTSLKGFGCDDFETGIPAAGALLKHLKTNLISNLEHISKITPTLNKGLMNLDVYTIKNLEIFNSLSSSGQHGTLINCIDSTLTSGGGRLLRSWLINPITNITKINLRLSVTEELVLNNKILNQLRIILKKSSDLQRSLGRISNGKITPREIIGISITLEKIDDIKSLFCFEGNKSLKDIGNSILETKLISEKIKRTLNDPAPINILKGGVIVTGFNYELDDLRDILLNGKKWINNYQEKLRSELQIPKLKISHNKVFGYYIEISKVNKDKVSESFIRKQTLVNSERYITEELKEYEEKLFYAQDKIYDLESSIFNDLCDYVLTKKSRIQLNAQILNKIDVLSCFAFNAIENNYSKPILTLDQIIDIKKGRHPVVEKLLPITNKFIPNDIKMDVKKNQIHLLTGPNMAGKSTYLRQIGLITLMSHIGSFVPAERVKIGIVDYLFTRVGASDNLASGESTFLVEMNEAANILNNATNKSLVLLDEIGRGTSTYDGLSIAWAITEYLHNKNNSNPRTLFATHYHELTNLESTLSRLENHHVEVKEFKEDIIFMRSVAKGAADKSYGIQVAKMAGVPKPIINRAEQILKSYGELHDKEKIIESTKNIEQINIFNERNNIKKKIEELEINKLTPIDALLILKDLKNEIDS